ncbi:TetR family transcriptional regulator [Microbacterium horticulturae]|uniref:TetR family transcriptional regulator n=1 Tax=Microbacterium horticulturae TaxID=3028316 RepID=A0ABY8C135_9MICO|nr:TetR family transcriptional regulator [Microbacterium sp. KACC 23027]WEG10114.1 TetR family transcriptional regulator [Microbacterium sp. KACC 23027]
MALTRDAVVDAALALLDADGLDAVTMRALARRAGVTASTLYWHVRDKEDLQVVLADRIMAPALRALPQIAPATNDRQWLFAASTALRDALRAHRDGARVVAGSRDSLGRAEFSDAAMAALVARGVPLADARIRVLAAERFTVGYVLDEQAPTPTAAPPDLAELERRMPTATQAIREYFAAGRTAEDVFIDTLRSVVGMDRG